jgi:hypothetical protein
MSKLDMTTLVNNSLPPSCKNCKNLLISEEGDVDMFGRQFVYFTEFYCSVKIDQGDEGGELLLEGDLGEIASNCDLYEEGENPIPHSEYEPLDPEDYIPF